VRLKRLGFAMLGESTKISIETDPIGDRFALHQEMERVFSAGRAEPKRIAVAQTKVIGATITARIDQDGSKPTRTRTFDITTRSCALKYEGHDLLLRQMLMDSGIDVPGQPVAAHGEPERPAA
jgi:hypothetical protein